ncbi:MAG TPA: hypothetical protein VET48_08495 [Steroidobacteraceae bacterium]|nr:hypothetical protein [Steroidobacteraceae bacterium]
MSFVKISTRTALLFIMTLLVTSNSWAADDGKSDAAQLQRNLHEMRAAMERERAQQDNAARASTPALRVDSVDAPGIGTMRQQLTQSLQHLENRCLGVDVNVKDGNAILICGSNNGTADNSTAKNTQTTVVLPQPVAQPAPAQPSEGVK